MTRDQIEAQIRTSFHEVLENANAMPSGELTDETVLLDSGLDSLGFAILVSQLEDDLGWDPFSLSDTAFYPSTYGEFVSFYADNQPQVAATK